MNRNGHKVLINNFTRLWEEAKGNGYSQERFAKELGVSQRTVSNLLLSDQTGRHVRIDTVDSIAAGLGVETWMLFVEGIPLELLKNHRLPKLVESYVLADEEGRRYITRVAEKESEYKAGDKEPHTATKKQR